MEPEEFIDAGERVVAVVRIESDWTRPAA